MNDVALTVLIIEDDRLSLELVSDVLGDAGWVVRQARTGEEGCAAAAADPPRLVLLDLGLPGMDGLATLRALRTDARTRYVSVVAMTAQAMRGSAEATLAAGFDGYLSKPIDTRGLVAEIERILAGRTDHR